MRFEFPSTPTVGTRLLVNDQEYRLNAVEPYTRADGAASSILNWSTACPDCGETFRIKTGLKGKDITRRCPPCRSPLKRVTPGHGRQSVVRVEEPR